MSFLDQYPSLPLPIQTTDILLIARGTSLYSLTTANFSITEAGLLPLLDTLIPTLPTAPSASGPTLWLNNGTGGSGVLTWS